MFTAVTKRRKVTTGVATVSIVSFPSPPMLAVLPGDEGGEGRWDHFNRISSLILNSNQRASFNLFLLVVGQGWGSEIESISDANDGICDCEEVLSGSENATLGN